MIHDQDKRKISSDFIIRSINQSLVLYGLILVVVTYHMIKCTLEVLYSTIRMIYCALFGINSPSIAFLVSSVCIF